MKNFITAIALATMSLTFAQDKNAETEKLSAEQRVELQVKKMTLDLDLNSTQQAQIKNLLTTQVKKREALKSEREKTKASNKKFTKEERFAKRSKMLDEQIAFKAEMKKILSEKQMEKWEANKKDRMHQHKNKMKKKHEKPTE